MKDLDFEKLADQYAGFLVAVGGVSVTVLTLILGIAHEPTEQKETEARLFLVAALSVAAVCCFIGAHMMAETAAFFSQLKEKLSERMWLGRRLFVLATANIFIGITLVLFAVVLLPKATGDFELAEKIKPISCVVFLSVAGGALVWMILAGIERTVAVGQDAWKAMAVAVAIGSCGGLSCSFLPMDDLPNVIFIGIVLLIFVSVLYFALIFWLGRACSRIHCFLEILFFTAAIAFSNVSLVVAYFKIR